jgi:hypothetical protein
MSDYIQRMQDESDELLKKIVKLDNFVHSTNIKLTDMQRSLLLAQLDAMKAYITVLDLRIKNEKGELK